MKIKDSNVTIMVSDMDRSVSFYEKIGFTLKKRWDNHYAMLSVPGTTLGLHPAGEKKSIGAAGASIGLFIENAEELKAFLDKEGISYSRAEADEGIYLNFQDPDGYYIYYTQPKWSY